MDDHDYSGLGRSLAFDQDRVSPGDYALETFVPPSNKVGDKIRDRNKADLFKTKPAKITKESHRTQRAPGRGATTIVGSSSKAKQLRETIKLYAEHDSPVLICGETGVGKELVARHLHAASDRADRPFEPLNTGALPETLAAAELFGHARGAFTGAVSEREGALSKANGGVLFLDEIGEMPLLVQTHLLRVLEDGMVTKLGGKTPAQMDFRLICATNADLKENIAKNLFRRDLYYRINVLAINVPPLRERGEDAVEIAEAMIKGHRDEKYRAIKLSPKAADRLKSYAFPGNVRELRNVLYRALVHARDGTILPEHLQFEYGASSNGPCLDGLFDVDDAKSLMSRFVMMKALHAADGNVSKAAALTGRSRGTFHTLKKSIEGEDFASAYQNICTEMKNMLNGC